MTHLDDALLRQVQQLAPDIARRTDRPRSGRLASLDRSAAVVAAAAYAALRLVAGAVAAVALLPVVILLRLVRK